jgi:SAM-dependent methyltransferase
MSDPIDLFGQVWDGLTAYQRGAALKTAIELDVFTAVGAGATTAAAIGARCAASERGIRSLCDRLVVDGLLTKQDGRYALASAAAMLLDRQSPSYIGSVMTFLGSPSITQAFAELTAAVRKGGTALPLEGTLAPEHPVWVDFARAMAPVAGMTAALVANVLAPPADAAWRVLDVAAGHGLFGIALARQSPRIEVTALDWPNVLTVARENADAAGAGKQVRLLPGDAFTTDFGTGYDLVLLTNFLHHFDPPTCQRLLAKTRAALAPGGRAVAVEFVPDEDRVSPPEAAAFSLVMLATTPAGDAFTLREYDDMFRAAGFAGVELLRLPPVPQSVVIGRT